MTPELATEARRRPGAFKLLLRGMLLRCPRCGGGHLFKGWFRMVERCPRCNYKFEREEGFFLGAYVINIGVSQLVAVAFIAISIIATLPDPPVGKLIVIGLVVVIATPFVFYPFSKTIWTAFDMIMHPECLDW
jgi:uncharacterized protein (DUF983 family)